MHCTALQCTALHYTILQGRECELARAYTVRGMLTVHTRTAAARRVHMSLKRTHSDAAGGSRAPKKHRDNTSCGRDGSLSPAQAADALGHSEEDTADVVVRARRECSRAMGVVFSGGVAAPHAYAADGSAAFCGARCGRMYECTAAVGTSVYVCGVHGSVHMCGAACVYANERDVEEGAHVCPVTGLVCAPAAAVAGWDDTAYVNAVAAGEALQGDDSAQRAVTAARGIVLNEDTPDAKRRAAMQHGCTIAALVYDYLMLSPERAAYDSAIVKRLVRSKEMRRIRASSPNLIEFVSRYVVHVHTRAPAAVVSHEARIARRSVAVYAVAVAYAAAAGTPGRPAITRTHAGVLCCALFYLAQINAAEHPEMNTAPERDAAPDRPTPATRVAAGARGPVDAVPAVHDVHDVLLETPRVVPGMCESKNTLCTPAGLVIYTPDAFLSVTLPNMSVLKQYFGVAPRKLTKILKKMIVAIRDNADYFAVAVEQCREALPEAHVALVAVRV